MKTKLLIIAIALGALTPMFAQLKTTTHDGIAASPKLREALNERADYAPIAVTVAFKPTANDGIAASPKLRESLNERAAYAPKAVTVAIEPTAVSLKASCNGYKVAASPRAQATFQLRTTGCCGMSSCVVACSR